jgi:Glycosyl hydrolase family 26
MIMVIGGVHKKIVPDKNGVYQGAFVSDDISEEGVKNFEAMAGEKLDIGLKFLAFTTGLNFPTREANVMSSRGGAIFIKMEPWSFNGKEDQSYSLKDIVSGKYDQLLKRFADGAAKFGKPIFVSFGHEMNGDWYPWAGDPDGYKKAYQYVHDKIESYGADNITWVWNPNIDNGMFNDYYPGDKYVDWVAADGYNTEDRGSQWRSFKELFDSSLDELQQFNKPIMVGEFGCDENNNTDKTVRKPQFLSGSLEAIASEKRIKAFVYFDINKEEGGAPKEWAIESPESRKAYAEAVEKYKALFVKDIQTENGVVEYKATATSVGKPFNEVVSSQGSFNGADGSISGTCIKLNATNASDPGLSIELKSSIKGHLALNYRGTVSGGYNAGAFTIIFIKKGPDWTKDVQLDKRSIVPSSAAKEASIEIPQGTDKISIMLVGKGSIYIELSNVRIAE